MYDYTILGTESGLQILTPTTVLDVVVVTGETNITRIRFTVPVPQDVWDSGIGAAYVNKVAGGLENLVTYHHVVSGTPAQEIDQHGYLQDFVAVTVAYVQADPSLPTLYGTVNVPLRDLTLGVPGLENNAPQLCDDEYARLEALATGVDLTPATSTGGTTNGGKTTTTTTP